MHWSPATLARPEIYRAERTHGHKSPGREKSSNGHNPETPSDLSTTEKEILRRLSKGTATTAFCLVQNIDAGPLSLASALDCLRKDNFIKYNSESCQSFFVLAQEAATKRNGQGMALNLWRQQISHMAKEEKKPLKRKKGQKMARPELVAMEPIWLTRAGARAAKTLKLSR